MSRPITQAEAAIVERALLVAPTSDVSPDLLASIPTLQVTAICDCGCATIWFGPEGAASAGKIVADGRGTAEGQDMDVIVWSQAESIFGLELVGPGAIPLPHLGSVRAHDVA